MCSTRVSLESSLQSHRQVKNTAGKFAQLGCLWRTGPGDWSRWIRTDVVRYAGGLQCNPSASWLGSIHLHYNQSHAEMPEIMGVWRHPREGGQILLLLPMCLYQFQTVACRHFTSVTSEIMFLSLTIYNSTWHFSNLSPMTYDISGHSATQVSKIPPGA